MSLTSHTPPDHQHLRMDLDKLTEHFDLAESTYKKFTWMVWSSLISTAAGFVLSLISSRLVFSSLAGSIHMDARYFLFLGGILLFQISLVFIIWGIRKRQGHLIELKQRLVDVYLTKLENSPLNPNPQALRN